MGKTLAVILLAAASAFAQKIQTEFDRTVSFSQFKTLAIRSGRLASANPSLNDDLIKKQLEADIQKRLEAKGLIPIRLLLTTGKGRIVSGFYHRLCPV